MTLYSKKSTRRTSAFRINSKLIISRKGVRRVVSSVFGNLDREATMNAFKQYLKEWKMWKLKALQRIPTIGSPSMDGQPHGSTYDPDRQQINHSAAEYEVHERVNCCKALKTIGSEEEILGDILYWRFIKGYSVSKTIALINDRYKEYMSKETFLRRQKEALWEGALICPNASVRVDT